MSQEVSPEEFNAVRPQMRRMSEASVNAVRAVLVEGKSQAEVAEANDWTRQRVNKLVSRVRAMLDEAPRGWERVEAWLPPELAEKVREMERLAREELKTKE